MYIGPYGVRKFKLNDIVILYIDVVNPGGVIKFECNKKK